MADKDTFVPLSEAQALDRLRANLIIKNVTSPTAEQLQQALSCLDSAGEVIGDPDISNTHATKLVNEAYQVCTDEIAFPKNLPKLDKSADGIAKANKVPSR